jgi:hypothetical protein
MRNKRPQTHSTLPLVAGPADDRRPLLHFSTHYQTEFGNAFALETLFQLRHKQSLPGKDVPNLEIGNEWKTRQT